MTPEELDRWPLHVGIQYGEEGPQVLCDGWVMYSGHPRPCNEGLNAENLQYLREDLQRHLEITEHVENPFLRLSLDAGKTVRARKRK